MPQAIKYKSAYWVGTDTPFAAHVQIPSGTDITQATIASIAWTVTESVGAQQGTVTGSGNCVVASSVFNTLQTGGAWTEDNTGYNFLFVVPGASFPDAGDYVVLFEFQPISGGTPIPLEFSHHAAGNA